MIAPLSDLVDLAPPPPGQPESPSDDSALPANHSEIPNSSESPAPSAAQGDGAPVVFEVLLHENGPALWPERFDEKRLRQIEQTLGKYYFSALYQGSPSPEGGGLFQRGWIQYYREHGEYYLIRERPVKKSQCRRFATVDLAFSTKKEADYTVLAAWAVTPECDLLLIDIHRDRMTGEQLVPATKSMMSKHDLEYVGIEDTQAQTLVVQTARRAGLTVRALKANLDKITRAIPAQIRMEAGQVFFPKSHPELATFEHELMTFPKGAHDDCVDTLSYAALEVQRIGSAPLPPEERERLEHEAAEREWQEKLRKQSDAQSDFDNERWWLS